MSEYNEHTELSSTQEKDLAERLVLLVIEFGGSLTDACEVVTHVGLTVEQGKAAFYRLSGASQVKLDSHYMPRTSPDHFTQDVILNPDMVDLVDEVLSSNQRRKEFGANVVASFSRENTL